MRLRLIVPQLVLSAIGVAVMVGEVAGDWTAGLLAGLVAGVMTAITGAVVLSPVVARIEALDAAVRSAAEREPAPPDGAPESPAPMGEDALAHAARTFAGLTLRWEERLRALTAESASLAGVLDSLDEGIWVTDTEGTIVRHNAALIGLLRPTGTIVGETPLRLVPSAELHEAVLVACRKMTTTVLELSIGTPRARTLAIQVLPLRGGLKGSAAVFRDLTELRRLEKVRKDFVANVSHELRTPIAAIRGYAETLRAGALEDREHAPKMVEIIHRQSERLSALVNDLLELSRLESGAQTLERAPVQLAEVATRAADAMRPRAATKALALMAELDPILWVLADARALEQVLLNLLDNAVKYTPSGGRVQMDAQRVDGRVTVSVRDTGGGIDEKHLGRIFERFYRVDKGRSRDTGGTGLGLSIVKHLVTAMGGEIRVRSDAGQGSEFTVSLPAAPPPGPGHPGGAELVSGRPSR
ncbi:MAG: PAS domain-containing protein [Myxococcaceae bacterium]|nr:PAS domain-containing protein [Myxococcaceae bacterium]